MIVDVMFVCFNAEYTKTVCRGGKKYFIKNEGLEILLKSQWLKQIFWTSY